MRYLIIEYRGSEKVPKLVQVRMMERLSLGLEALIEFYDDK